MAHLNEWQKFQEHLLLYMGSREAEEVAVLAARTVLEEREACAKIADASAAGVARGSCSWGTASLIAEAIRKRTD